MRVKTSFVLWMLFLVLLLAAGLWVLFNSPELEEEHVNTLARLLSARL